MLAGMFGGKKAAPPPQPAADTGGALQAITAHMETLDKKEEHLEKKIRAMKMKAVELNKSKRPTDKKQAMNKMNKQQLQQIAGTKSNMLSQRMAIEGQAMTNETLKVMEQSQRAMKQGMDLEHAEEVVADVQEGMERQAELANAISTPMDGGGMPIDEDDLMAELADLEAEFAEEEEDMPVDLSSLGVASGPIGGQTVEQMLADAPRAPTAAPTISSAADAELADLLDFAN
jgi:charged multivesicular body protein 4A/B